MDREEIANAVTHGAGLILCLVFVPLLWWTAFGSGDAGMVTGSLLFGLSLIGLYASSTGYHLAKDPVLKGRLRLLDHVGIYVLIAGSYSPFTLVSLRGHGGMTLFVLIWAMALGGILYKVCSHRRYRWFSTAYYLAMGWLAVAYVRPFLDVLPLAALLWIAAGGVFYTVGVGFYAWKRLPYAHAVWHLFVLAGSVCHYIAVFAYVRPR